jgi:hypothetical protein
VKVEQNCAEVTQNRVKVTQNFEKVKQKRFEVTQISAEGTHERANVKEKIPQIQTGGIRNPAKHN